MNYKHLHYFWTVLRTGSIARASAELHLTPQTLSGQINLLEDRHCEIQAVFNRQTQQPLLGLLVLLAGPV